MLVFVKSGKGRHWIDMVPYDLKSDTFYFTTPEQIHLKEDASLNGTAIYLTREFLLQKGNEELSGLPIIRNPFNSHELILSNHEKHEIDNLLVKVLAEYRNKEDLNTEMLFAYLRVLLVFVSRIYNEQYNNVTESGERNVYHRFQECIEAHFLHSHEVAVYAKAVKHAAANAGPFRLTVLKP